MMRALNAAWKHNAKTSPVAGDEMPASGGHSVQEERATYAGKKVPAKVAAKHKG
jgi:hypothetical protein